MTSGRESAETGATAHASVVEAVKAGDRYVQTVGLVKAYRGRRVVDTVSITVKAGEIVGLLGQNGAGKTTTFYMVVGLVRPNAGTVLLDGEDITHLPMHIRARRGLGYLPQNECIFRRMTVEDNLLAILELQPGLSRADRNERLEMLLEELHIENRRKQMANTLSGGERRRAEIARALATHPTFLLLDEPFTGVDPLHVSEIRSIIEALRQRLGIGVLMTDHNPTATLKLCDRAYIMSEGEIFRHGPSEEIAVDPEVLDRYLGQDFTL
jgi:lipopolysaccharide export system ATP-binding protein